MENSGYESPLLIAGIVLLVILSCVVNLIKKGAEESRKNEFESSISKRRMLPHIQRSLEPVIKSQSRPRVKPKSAPTPKPISIPESQHDTGDEIIQEVVAALIKMGYAKTEAKKIVSELCANSTFDSSEELLQAAFSK